MNTAKRLRRRAASTLKVVSDLDETAVADGQPQAATLYLLYTTRCADRRDRRVAGKDARRSVP